MIPTIHVYSLNFPDKETKRALRVRTSYSNTLWKARQALATGVRFSEIQFTSPHSRFLPILIQVSCSFHSIARGTPFSLLLLLLFFFSFIFSSLFPWNPRRVRCSVLFCYRSNGFQQKKKRAMYLNIWFLYYFNCVGVVEFKMLIFFLC